MKNKMRSLLTNKNLWVLVAFAGVVALSTSDACAQSENIQNSMTRLLTWTSKILGGLAVTGGLIWTGIRMSMGDEHALKKGGLAVGGGVIIFSATWILNLLQGFFQ